MARAVVDLTPSGTLARLLAANGLHGSDWGFPTHLWRCVGFAPRQSEQSPTAQALTLVAKHFAAHDLQLFQTPFAELSVLSAERWRSLAVSALSFGLAYSGENSEAVASFVSGVLASFEGVHFLSNHFGNHWTALTSHTFDACLVAHDAALLAVIFVVDED